MIFNYYVEEFKQFLKSLNYAESTISNYSYFIAKFLKFIEEHYIRIKTVEKITKNILLDYQSHLIELKNKNGMPLSNSTKTFMLKSVKKFFYFLIRRDYILKDPSTIITLPKEERRIIRNILTKEELSTLLNSLKATDPISLRNRAIIELFYSCGIRTSELCSLMVNDIDLKKQTVTIIKGKGGKSRILPIGQYCTYFIELYINKARKYFLKAQKDDSGFLFLSYRGKPFNKSSINRNVIQKCIKSLKLKKHISAYSFRHSVAKHLLENKVDIMYIAQLLGHSSLKTTQQYLKIEISDLEKMHSLYHPRENNMV